MKQEKEFPWVAELLQVLGSGRPVIMPCDTIYGIVGIVPVSEEIIRDIKGRDESKPFLQLIRKEWLPGLVKTIIPDNLLKLWPGPLTLIVEGVDNNSIAVRVPDDKRLLYIMKKLKKPLYSTSVNRSGNQVLYKADEIKKEFQGKVDLFANEGDLPGGLPSTILDIREKPYRLIREGACFLGTDILRG